MGPPVHFSARMFHKVAAVLRTPQESSSVQMAISTSPILDSSDYLECCDCKDLWEIRLVIRSPQTGGRGPILSQSPALVCETPWRFSLDPTATPTESSTCMSPVKTIETTTPSAR